MFFYRHKGVHNFIIMPIKKQTATENQLKKGWKGKIHLHPKHNTNWLDKRPGDINKNGAVKKNIAWIIASLKDQGYESVKKWDIEEIYRFLTGLTEATLREIVADKENPMHIRAVANYLVRDWRKNGIWPFEKILERAIWVVESTPPISVNVTTEAMNFLQKMNQLKND